MKGLSISIVAAALALCCRAPVALGQDSELMAVNSAVQQRDKVTLKRLANASLGKEDLAARISAAQKLAAQPRAQVSRSIRRRSCSWLA